MAVILQQRVRARRQFPVCADLLLDRKLPLERLASPLSSTLKEADMLDGPIR
jgi:hypothetical protein